jgi:HK97 family phage prohead protease
VGISEHDRRPDRDRRKAASLKGTREQRTFAGLELETRETSDGQLKLEMYASVADVPYRASYWTERVARGAWRRTINEQCDTQLLVNHTGVPLARSKSGTMTLEEDGHGLLVRASLDPDDLTVQQVARAIRRGDLDQCSVGFVCTDDEWGESEGRSTRLIKSA